MNGLAVIDTIVSANTIQSVWNELSRYLCTQGFDRAIYGLTRCKNETYIGDPNDWVLLSNHCDEYMKGLLGHDVLTHSPAYLWSRDHDGILFWHWMNEYSTDELTPNLRKLREHNLKFDVIAGCTHSFTSETSKVRAFVSVTGSIGMSQDDVDETWKSKGAEIERICKIAHLQILRLPYGGSRKLTSRQKEVLQWISDGKSIKDVAVVLGVSRATIEKHLKSTRTALNVETTAQAVQKATLENQLFF